ncbi:MAG: hypothetical protein M3P70_17535 [Actinomycetota bacterium]|nr:hypothetical protein [Actinomycetota bacterium]
MTTHGPARGPSPEEPEQPMLPFEQSAPASGDGEPTAAEIEPREVWRTLSAATRAGVRRDCLRAMRRVIGDASE